MKKLTTALALVLYLLCSCKKDNNDLRIIPVPKGAISDAGINSEMDLWDPLPTAIHIDPTNTSDNARDGSLDHPYISFDEIKWYNDTVYALKRGTTLESKQIRIDGNNVIIASYGEGDRPLIRCTDVTTSSANVHAIITYWDGVSDVTIRDIEVTGSKVNSCMRFLKNCNNIKVINCKLHDSYWGLRSLENTNIYIYNTEVYDTYDDGIFIENNTNIEIANCYVHNVNRNWSPPSTPEEDASGDGIQFNNCDFWHVHHNIIDRTSSGNKFCFISNNPNQRNGLFEFNILTGPLVEGFSIYLHNGANLIFRYNHIKAPSNSPFYSHGSNMLVYGNIFDNLTGPLYSSKSATVYNNVFYRMPMAIKGGTIEASNNIYELNEDANHFQVSNLTGTNNLFVTGTPTEGSFSGNAAFTDPENEDFHIMSNSDAIDKGIDVDITRDMDGVEIPQGGAPDIGAFEFYE